MHERRLYTLREAARVVGASQREVRSLLRMGAVGYCYGPHGSILLGRLDVGLLQDFVPTRRRAEIQRRQAR